MQQQGALQKSGQDKTGGANTGSDHQRLLKIGPRGRMNLPAWMTQRLQGAPPPAKPAAAEPAVECVERFGDCFFLSIAYYLANYGVDVCADKIRETLATLLRGWREARHNVDEIDAARRERRFEAAKKTFDEIYTEEMLRDIATKHRAA